jgi:hypothetical protein
MGEQKPKWKAPHFGKHGPAAKVPLVNQVACLLSQFDCTHEFFLIEVAENMRRRGYTLAFDKMRIISKYQPPEEDSNGAVSEGIQGVGETEGT